MKWEEIKKNIIKSPRGGNRKAAIEWSDLHIRTGKSTKNKNRTTITFYHKSFQQTICGEYFHPQIDKSKAYRTDLAIVGSRLYFIPSDHGTYSIIASHKNEYGDSCMDVVSVNKELNAYARSNSGYYKLKFDAECELYYITKSTKVA